MFLKVELFIGKKNICIFSSRAFKIPLLFPIVLSEVEEI